MNASVRAYTAIHRSTYMFALICHHLRPLTKLYSPSLDQVTRAKKLITLINKKYVEDFYSRRIARVALIRQKDIIEEMIENGALSPKWGKALLETIEDDNTRMDRDTQASHRYENG